MKKQILTCVFLLAVVGYGYAQDSGSQSSGGGDFAPSAGDISASFFFGRSPYQTSGFNLPSAPYNNTSWQVSGQNPYINSIGTDNSLTNMAGAEARYFVTNRIAAKLSGGAIFRNSPSVVNVPGFADPDGNNAAWVPAIVAVQADNRVDAFINLGGEYHFTTKYSRLFPYVGLTIPFYYGRQSAYDPTIVDVLPPFGTQGGAPSFYYWDGTQWIINNPSPTSPAGGTSTPYLADVGNRHSEQYGFGLQAAAGFDYYISEGLYFGFEIKPISWIYSGTNNIPGPGLQGWSAETSTWAFFAQPFVKLGIRF